MGMKLILRFNSLIPGDAYMRKQIRQSLLQIMACRLFGDKPLSEPILAYCSVDPGNKLHYIWIKIHWFYFKKMHLKMFSANWWLFCSGFCTFKVAHIISVFNTMMKSHEKTFCVSWASVQIIHWRPISLTIFPPRFIFDIWKFCLALIDFKKVTAAQFYTWHDSCAVVASAKIL